MSQTDTNNNEMQGEATLQRSRTDFTILSKQLRDLQAEIDVKIGEQSAALRTRATAESRQALELQIENLEKDAQQLEKHLKRLRASIKRLENEEPNEGLNDDEERPASSTENSSFTASHLVPNMLPTFGEGSSDIKDPEEFTSKFTKVLQAHRLPLDSNWSRLLPLCLEQQDAEWVAENLSQVTRWQDAMERFMEHYAHPLRRTIKVRELWSAKQRKTESLRQYCDRFQKLMRECYVKDDNVALTELFISTLPSTVQRDIQITKFANPSRTFSRVAEVAVMAIAMEATIPGPTKQEETRHHEVRDKATDRKWKTCSLHGSCSHTTAECYTLKARKDTKSEPKDRRGTTAATEPGSVASSDRSKDYKCYSCGEPGHRAFECPKKKTDPGSKPHVKLTSIHDAPADSPDEMDAFEGLTIQDYEEIMQLSTRMATLSPESKENKKPAPHTKAFEFPITINDNPQMALLDTGSTHSLIEPSIVKQLGLRVVPRHGVISLAHHGITAPRTGVTEEVTIKSGARIVTCQLEVMALPDGPPIVIGQDIFDRLGFSIHGLPISHDGQQTSSDPVADTSPPLVPTECTDEESDQSFQARRRAIIAALQPAITENQAIPRNSFCTVPESVVRLNTPPGETAWRRQYKIPHNMEPLIDEAVENWQREGIIQRAPVNTTFNSPLTLAPKKDLEGKWTLKRPCLDPRPLNLLLEDDRFPIPCIRDIFGALTGAQIFTTLDLKAAYHRFQIHPEDQHKTAFTWNNVQWMFQGAPFGLKVLTSKFQRVMGIVLGGLSYVLMFVDDIIVFSQHIEDHAMHVIDVIRRLTKAGLILNPDKCNFARLQLLLLGFVVSKYGHQIDPNKLVNIKDWQPPTTSKQVQHYLGVFNYFREHVPLMSTLTASMDALRNASNVSAVWKQEHQEAFDALKTLLPQLPPLAYPDFAKPFFVATDASNVGVGAVLYQDEDNPPHKYVSFQARSLQPAERKYSATKKELLAVVFAFKKFHSYLWGNPFTLFTDHRALVYLHTQKDLNPMMQGWLDTLFNYTFTVVHRPGILNILPDHLSRLFPRSAWEGHVVTNPTSNISVAIVKQQDPLGRIEPVENVRIKLMEEKHLLGHFGSEAIMQALHEDGYHWSTIKKDCIQVVSSCSECQRFNITRQGFHPLKAIHAELPFDHVAIDLAGPFTTSDTGNHYLLVVVDVCTRFVFLRAIPDKRAITIAQELFKIFCDVGFPKILQDDNGTEFVNKIVDRIVKASFIEQRLISAYHPRANGLAERNVQTALNTIRKSIQGIKKDWDKYVPAVQLAMNAKVAALHGSTPFSLMFGRRLNGFQDYREVQSRPLTSKKLQERLAYITTVVYPAISERSKKAQEGMIQRFKTHAKDVLFPEGSFVMVKDVTRNDKMDPRYEGPFKVIRRNKGGAYILQDNTGALLSRNFPPSALKLISQDPILAGQSYEVEAILNHDGEGRHRRYLVKWKGYDHAHNSWEPVGNFDDIAVIDRYWQRRSV